MNSHDHNLADEAKRRAEIDTANLQYKSDWPELCKQVGITPNMLNRIDPRVLIAIMLIRINALYTGKMIDLETRIRALEPHGPMMPTRR